MRRVFCAAALLWALVTGVAALAQEAWVQIEAQPSLSEAEARARAYSGVFPNVAGYALSTGWYGIMIGPFTPEEAVRQLELLKRERLIPGDSYIAESGRFRERFWPVGAGALGATPPTDGSDDGTATGPEALSSADPAVPTLPDETPREARASEAALLPEDRQAIQSALQWMGFYTGKIDGAFGAGTRKSMGAWQAAKGYEESGILTTAQRAELTEDYRAEVASIGLETVTSTEAGIEVTLPTALVEFARFQPPFVQYDARNGSGYQVLLISQQGDEATLFGLYDIMQTLEIVPLDGERERKAGAFVLTGKDAEVQSYTQAELRGGLIKGFTLVWPPEDGDRAVRVLEAMKSSFKPTGDRALDDSLGAPLAEDKATLLAGLQVRRPTLSRSGFFLDGTGLVATAADTIAGCGRITIDGLYDADVLTRDPARNLAILTPRQPLAPRATVAFQTSTPRLNAEVAVGGYPYEDALETPVTTFGTLEALSGLDGEAELTRLALTARPGDAGGPVLDSSGALIGMLLPRQTGKRVLPGDVHYALDASAISAALAAQGIVPESVAQSGAMPAEDLSRLASGITVLVSCWE
jgi:peptidoglycan hydrolase-like protein with peptidoglycan-binding domain